jgi:hypothetical protein
VYDRTVDNHRMQPEQTNSVLLELAQVAIYMSGFTDRALHELDNAATSMRIVRHLSVVTN